MTAPLPDGKTEAPSREAASTGHGWVTGTSASWRGDRQSTWTEPDPEPRFLPQAGWSRLVHLLWGFGHTASLEPQSPYLGDGVVTVPTS